MIVIMVARCIRISAITLILYYSTFIHPIILALLCVATEYFFRRRTDRQDACFFVEPIPMHTSGNDERSLVHKPAVVGC